MSAEADIKFSFSARLISKERPLLSLKLTLKVKLQKNINYFYNAARQNGRGLQGLSNGIITTPPVKREAGISVKSEIRLIGDRNLGKSFYFW